MKKLTEQDLKEKIIRKSYPEPNTGCWIWGASINADGYGIQKASLISNKVVTAHRVSYWIFKEHYNIDELSVLHTCDNPACVNPDHLFLGTQADNIADRHNKKRSRGGSVSGSKCIHSKLVESDVINIRALFPDKTESQIASMYGVTQSNISAILNRKSWKHI